jgi:hypothetical protein
MIELKGYIRQIADTVVYSNKTLLQLEIHLLQKLLHS